MHHVILYPILHVLYAKLISLPFDATISMPYLDVIDVSCMGNILPEMIVLAKRKKKILM